MEPITTYITKYTAGVDSDKDGKPIQDHAILPAFIRSGETLVIVPKMSLKLLGETPDSYIFTRN